MTFIPSRRLVLSSLALSLLAFVAVLPGVLDPAWYEPFLGQRGLTRLQTLMQDLAFLLLAPALAGAALASRRGAPRALVAWGGLLVFTLYYFAFYVIDKLFTPLYPAYLAIVALSLWSLAGLLAEARAAAPRDYPAALPRKSAAILLGSTLLFVPLWLAALAADIAARTPSPASTVFILDLCFLIPAALGAAFATWRRAPGAVFPAGILLVKSVLTGFLLAAGTLYSAATGGALNPGELALYLALSLPGALILALWLRALPARPAA